MSRFARQGEEYGRFRESLRYEDVVRNQVAKCIEVFNTGDPDATIYAMESLGNLVTQPEIPIGPQSDTLTVQFNQFAVKLAFAFGSFSILLLQPVIEGIFVKQKGDE